MPARRGIVVSYETIRRRRLKFGPFSPQRSGGAVRPHAHYGYRYIGKAASAGHPRYEVVAEEARVVQQIFRWVGHERWMAAHPRS